MFHQSRLIDLINQDWSHWFSIYRLLLNCTSSLKCYYLSMRPMLIEFFLILPPLAKVSASPASCTNCTRVVAPSFSANCTKLSQRHEGITIKAVTIINLNENSFIFQQNGDELTTFTNRIYLWSDKMYITIDSFSEFLYGLKPVICEVTGYI